MHKLILSVGDAARMGGGMRTESAGENRIIGTRMLTETDVEREYRLGKPWLRKRRRLGDGPPFMRIRRMVRYARKDLENWLASHVVEGRR